MVRITISRALSASERTAVRRFLDDTHALDCAQLSDHLKVDLEHGPRPGFSAAMAHDERGRLVGYAQASAGNDGFVVDSIVSSLYSGDVDDVRVSLLHHLLAALPHDVGITWWTHDDSAGPLAASLGLQRGRALLKMSRPLPLPSTVVPAGDVLVRPFEVGRDEAAWLEVNNAAFAWHGEQGGWDISTVRQREQEAWFRPEGFLLHERDGRLAAFCWTKLHPPHDADNPLVGEIYVIAVHPDFHGLGLGKALTVAGLNHLHAVGAEEGMLYVDAENTSAVRLYDRLGFEVSHTDQAYVRSTGGSPS
jgi:mycothiol synthase